MGDFARDTRIEPAGAAGRFTAELSEDWAIWGPNGGYLTAIALRAAGAVATIRRPATLTTHFLRSPQFAPVDLEVEVLHAGRRSESLRVAMSQGGKRMLECLVRTAAEGPGLTHGAPAPAAPEPQDLKRFEDYFETPPPRFAFWSNLDTRPTDPGRMNWGPVRAPRLLDWYRFISPERFEDPWLDAGRLALLVDSMGWPAASQPHPRSEFIAPSIECSVAFHDFAAESVWLLCEQVSPIAVSGLVAAHGKVWSQDGRLLASGSTQMMCAPVPPRG